MNFNDVSEGKHTTSMGRVQTITKIELAWKCKSPSGVVNFSTAGDKDSKKLKLRRR